MSKRTVLVYSRLAVCAVGVIMATWVAATPLAVAAQGPQNFVGKLVKGDDAQCTECHDPTAKKHTLAIYQTRHGVKADSRAPSCQTCHGPSEVHIKDSGKLTDVSFDQKLKNVAPLAERNGICLQCHDGQARTNWAGSQHETADLACSNCHTIHAADQKVLNKVTQAEVCLTCHKTQRSQIHRVSAHPLAVQGMTLAPKMSCSDCHNPHGSIAPSLMAKGSINDTCFSCHAEKRGPFLWEHSPVSDNCINCHTPHGSSMAPLLKTRQPVLCQDCHSGDHANAVQSGANLASGAVTTLNGNQQLGALAPRQQLGARGCINCHSMVHGSNHPGGAKFMR